MGMLNATARARAASEPRLQNSEMTAMLDSGIWRAHRKAPDPRHLAPLRTDISASAEIVLPMQDDMLPDFPHLKRRVNTRLLRFVREQVPALAPLLRDVSSYMQHEGSRGDLIRADESRDSTTFEAAHFEFELPKEEMRVLDIEALKRRLMELAEQLAAHQSRLMLTRVGEAATAVGNEVNAGGDLRPEHVLEVMRKLQVDFDPLTNKPKPGRAWVMHPDTAAKVVAKMQQWEKDPLFIAELNRIEDQQREDWRAREARRILAD